MDAGLWRRDRFDNVHHRLYWDEIDTFRYTSSGGANVSRKEKV
ncbi:hypothetical protein PAMC26510_28030 [Caballeronia sordidicola]|uniref:Uncharacterized protein n=1 Tax=Caballeronia sordidicola TaxID=196367 RepID=A0A242MD03_CABSO|nr:hypothetical protein PAMC26510_28030 [Caballeronia sordidicola]OTP72258.1 hypothetical protein PAMC26577_21155 [Caballeronia sordidicola]